MQLSNTATAKLAGHHINVPKAFVGLRTWASTAYDASAYENATPMISYWWGTMSSCVPNTYVVP